MAYQAGPFDSAHWYVQWGGKLPGGEAWSCGLRIANTAGGSPINDPAMVTAVSNAVKTFHTSNGSGISSRALLSFVKTNLVDVNGHYKDAVTYSVLHPDLPGGAGTAISYPNQVCNVVSLTTGYSRGPAHRGRIYLPLPVFGLDTNNQYAAANASLVVSAVNTLIASLNAQSSNSKVAVFSRKLGAPSHRLVTGCAVGRVYDTQRRRRNKNAEDYQGQNV